MTKQLKELRDKLAIEYASINYQRGCKKGFDACYKEMAPLLDALEDCLTTMAEECPAVTMPAAHEALKSIGVE